MSDTSFMVSILAWQPWQLYAGQTLGWRLLISFCLSLPSVCCSLHKSGISPSCRHTHGPAAHQTPADQHGLALHDIHSSLAATHMPMNNFPTFTWVSNTKQFIIDDLPVLVGKRGISLYGNTVLFSSSSARSPRPEPQMMAILGRCFVLSSSQSAVSLYSS